MPVGKGNKMKKLILMLTLAITACGGDSSSSSSDKANTETVFDMWATGDGGLLNFRGMVMDVNFPFGFTSDETKCTCDILFMGYENRGSIIVSACIGDATYTGHTHASINQICRDEFHGVTRYEVEGGLLTLVDDEGYTAQLPRY